MADSSYKSIIKTSGLIGAVQVARIVFGLANSKVIALFIGTEGYGIFSLYSSFSAMVDNFAVLGVNQSGVRDIAKAKDDRAAVEKCIWVLRRIIFVCCSIVALVSIIFSKAISSSLFGSYEYAWGVILVSTTILLNGISKGQVAILNGFRQIKDLARSQIIGAAIGSAATISSVILLRNSGIPVYIFIISATATATTWFYVRKLKIKNLRPHSGELKTIAKGLIFTGLGFSIAALASTLTAYVARVYLASLFGLSGVGIYMACWTLSNLYVGIVLSAMGVDFMPRIMSAIGDNTLINKLLNEQMELGILISGIGVVALLVFSPFILKVFYSSEFAAGASIIRWQILGVALRVLSYPLGYVLMGKKMVRTYVCTQVGFYVVELLFLVFAASFCGFNFLGINYLTAYGIYTIIMGLLLNRHVGFRPSPLLKRLLATESLLLLAAIIISMFLEGMAVIISGSLLVIITLIISYLNLKRHMQVDMIALLFSKLNRL